MNTNSMSAQHTPATRFRVVRIDMWDYRHPTDHVFDDQKAASEKADELQRLSDQTIADPTSCYCAIREDTIAKATGGAA